MEMAENELESKTLIPKKTRGRQMTLKQNDNDEGISGRNGD